MASLEANQNYKDIFFGYSGNDTITFKRNKIVKINCWLDWNNQNVEDKVLALFEAEENAEDKLLSLL